MLAVAGTTGEAADEVERQPQTTALISVRGTGAGSDGGRAILRGSTPSFFMSSLTFWANSSTSYGFSMKASAPYWAARCFSASKDFPETMIARIAWVSGSDLSL